jgi:hypothetical protein
MALAVTPTGDLFLGGDFEQYNGVGATRLARWDGSIWRPFTSGPGNGLNDRSTAVAVAPNGNVYVAGWFYRAGGQPLYNLACWNGSSWSSLGLGPGSGINGSISALAVAPNGDVYIGGNFSQVGTVPANGVARWNGSTWSALSSSTGNGVSGWVRAMAVTPTGELYVGGQFGSAGGRTANAVAHWNGTAWDNMSGGIPNSNQSPTTWAMALAPNGTLYVAGGFDRSNAGWGPNVLSWNGSTWAALPSGYGPNAVSTIVTLAVAPNGDLYAGGVFSRLDGQTIYNLARWNGTAWNALGSSPGGGLTNTSPWRVNTLLVDPNGELYVGGGFPQAGGTLVNNIARWDGNAWSALGSGINGEVAAIARDATGKLYVAGNFGGVGDNSKASSHFAVYDPQAVLGTSSTTTLPTLTLSPNPAHTTVLLTGLPASAQPIKAELRNELGQLVRHCELCSVAGQASLSVAGLPAGTYLLHLPTTAGLTVRRLVVE